MIARAVKQVFRIKLREAVIHFRQVQALKVETELQNIALAILNEILNKVRGSLLNFRMAGARTCRRLWRTSLVLSWMQRRSVICRGCPCSLLCSTM